MSAKIRRRKATAVLKSGEKVVIPAWTLDSGKPGPCLLMTAAQHGNEVQGAEIIRRFVDMAARDMKAGKLIAVPFVNLPAIRARRPHIRMKPEQPYGDDRGHNMNRTWPGRRAGNDTARVSHAIYEAFGRQCTHVLDFHCWTKFRAPAVLIRDTRASHALAAKLGHRFVNVSAPDKKSGTITGFFCNTGRAGVTYECSGQYLVDEREVRLGLRVAVNMARAIGLLPGRLLKADRPIVFSDQSVTCDVHAPCSGLFVGRELALSGHVRKGTVLGHVFSDRDLSCREVRAPRAGYLLGYGGYRANPDVALPAQHPYMAKGDRIAQLRTPRR